MVAAHVCDLFVICLLLVSTTSYNPISTALVVLATSLFLWRQQVDDCKKLLSSKILLWIGTRSYSIYLWHWSLVVVAKWETLELNDHVPYKI